MLLALCVTGPQRFKFRSDRNNMFNRVRREKFSLTERNPS
jgi:hypothetical protein